MLGHGHFMSWSFYQSYTGIGNLFGKKYKSLKDSETLRSKRPAGTRHQFPGHPQTWMARADVTIMQRQRQRQRQGQGHGQSHPRHAPEKHQEEENIRCIGTRIHNRDKT